MPYNPFEKVEKERRRDELDEGWSREHDDEHDKGEMAMAAACYAAPEPISVWRSHVEGLGSNVFIDAWPWDKKWDKRDKHDRKRRLVIAGALIVAELERLDRIED